MRLTNNHKTTIAGILTSAVLMSGVNAGKLLSGDIQEISKLIAALLVGLVGYFAAKRNADGHATVAGVTAGSLYAVSGELQTVITGVVIALLGYLTNKAHDSD